MNEQGKEGYFRTVAVPTQAQIEAARKVLRNSSCFCDEVCSLLPCKCVEAALTAAAEVQMDTISDNTSGMKSNPNADPALRDFIRDTPISEPNDGWAGDHMAEINPAWKIDRAVKGVRNATIERCAQVVETAKLPVHHFDGAIGMCKTVDARIAIAAHIRALKEKP